LALAISTVTATPAHAAVVSFNCPTGGGTYQVDTGALTGFTGTCSGDLILDSSVITINTYAFSGTSVNTLTIPSTVTSILGAPFSDGGNTLTAILVDASNPNYSSLSGVLFDKTQTELIVYPASKPGTTYVIPASVTSTRYYAFSSNKNLTSINLPNTLTTLGGQAFISATALTTVNIGTGLTDLGEQSFAWIPTLTSINVDASNTSFASIGGVLYNKNISKLWAYPANKAGTSYTAPNTVTSTAYTVFGASENLLTVDLTPVVTLSGQEFHSASSVEEVIFGNSLTVLVSQALQSASGLKKLTLGTGLTTIQDYAFYNNVSLNCVIYAGNNSTIQNYAYPNSVVPVASASNCLTAPVFTLSPSTITATTGLPVTSYAITSTGGAIASFSISPAISNTPGLSFSTSTGLISGTPTTTASSRTYTITGTNALGTTSRTFSITVQAPTPIPFLKIVTNPKMNLVDGKFVCSAGTYQFGYTILGVVDQSSIFLANPSTFTHTLFINGSPQGSGSVTTPNKTNAWSLAQTGSGSIVTCAVSASFNSITIVGTSTDNVSGLPAAQSTQKRGIAISQDTYNLAVRANLKAHQKALVDNRATWRKQTAAIRTNYYDTLNRIKANGGSKMITDIKNALAVKSAAQETAAADYATSKQAAVAARDAANKSALDANKARIVKVNASYGTYIESIGHGVLIP
jgi:hypothetical protein